MRMHTTTLIAALVLLVPASMSVAQFSDKAVEEAIKKGTAFLLQEQQKDGSWGRFIADPKAGPANPHYQVTGPTALAAYALMECDVSPQNPQIAKALEWLGEQKEDHTYSLALRANAWLAANRTTKAKYIRPLEKDVGVLVSATRTGAYHYLAKPQNTWCNSNSQYGVLGLWAGVQGNVELPTEIWKRVMGHWEKCQNHDGGWPYSAGGESTAAMTAGGVASLYVCLDSLFNQAFLQCQGNMNYKPITAGLDWLDKNFQATMQGQKLGHSDMPYYLYALERTGLASGRKYFGKQDWYKAGATWLVGQQAPDGSWTSQFNAGNTGKTLGTAYALLFLIRGRNPVLFNKLEHGGDWNNRPRDMASAALWISTTFEKAMNWQIVNPDVPVAEWHDAPLLYIAGSRNFAIAAQNEEKLRTFVNQGGTIFSCTECGGAGFKANISAVYAKLFPQYKLAPAPPAHEIYTVYYKPNPARLQFQIMSNGIRPIVIHTDVDLPLIWQARKYATGLDAFQGATNVIKYVADSFLLLRPRGTTHWPADAGAGHTATIKIVRLKHSGNFDPEPLAYERLARLMGQRAKVKLEVEGPIAIADLAKTQAKLAVMTGAGKVNLTDDEKATLKAFVMAGGGTIMIDAAGGNRDFAGRMEEMIADLFGNRSLRTLAANAPLYTLPGMAIDKVEYRRQTRLRLNNLKTPNLKAVIENGRAAVIFSAEDITGALVGYPSSTVDGYEPDSAFELMRNIILHGTQGNPRP